MLTRHRLQSLWILFKLDRDIYWDNISDKFDFRRNRPIIGQFMGQKLCFVYLNVVNAIQATILLAFFSNFIGTFIGTISQTSLTFGEIGQLLANLCAKNSRFVYLNVVNAIQATILFWFFSNLIVTFIGTISRMSSTFGKNWPIIWQFMGQKLRFCVP